MALTDPRRQAGHLDGAGLLVAHDLPGGTVRAMAQAAAWLAAKGIDQWQEPWPTET